MKLTTIQMLLLKEHGFQWYKGGTTDRVENDIIKDIIAAPEGFTVLYNEPAVFEKSTAVVNKIEFPSADMIEDQWIRVHWESIKDEQRAGPVTPM